MTDDLGGATEDFGIVLKVEGTIVDLISGTETLADDLTETGVAFADDLADDLTSGAETLADDFTEDIFSADLTEE